MEKKACPPLDDLRSILGDVPWPKSTDQMFVAGEGEDGRRNNAQLMHDWGDRWSTYATGYKKAADLIVDQVRNGIGYQDFLLYPVMFLYRQYLELAIKNLIFMCWRLLEIVPDDDLGAHDIKRYWSKCDALLQQISPGDSVKALRDVGRLIDEFSQHDPISMAFRYPVSRPDKATKERKPTLQGLDVVNLRNVQEVIANIAVLFDGAEAQVGSYLSEQRAWEADFLSSSGDRC
jgi:hypothetical protein